MKEPTTQKKKKAASPAAGPQKTAGLEKTAGLIYAVTLAGLLAMKTDGFLIISTLLFVLLVALWDLHSYRIPNFFTLPTMAAALIFHAASGWNGLLHAVSGLFLGGLLLLIPHLLGGVGAGDVKTLAALGALWGAGPALQIFVATALMGGVIGVAILIARGEFINNLRRYWSIIKVFFVTRKMVYIPPSKRVSAFKIPYGAVISMAVAVWHFGGPII